MDDFKVTVKSTNATPEYQYHLKDHLGNVRLTFTTQITTKTFTAGFETGNQTTEAGNFSNYQTNKINTLTPANPNATTGNSAYYLNGGYAGQVGLTKSFSVMPGDQVSIQANVRYNAPTTTAASFTSFAASLLSAFNLAAPAGGETGTAASGVNTFANWETGATGNESKSDAIKAFATIILFDRNYNFLDVAYQAVQANGTVSVTYTAKQPGYAYIYISNEHPYLMDVYFDDVNVTFTPSAVIQVQDYYPFGLAFNQYQRENSVKQDYLYNGKELQGELNLNWYDYQARMYDPIIARWMAIDPLSEKSRRWSPYTYCYNNPLLFVDPDGMFSDFFDKDGKKTNHIEDGSNAQYQIKGEGQFQHYELKEGEAAFDKSQNGKNEVTKESVTSAIQEQQNLNQSNPSLKAVKLADGTNQTYCNFATENITRTVASATGDKNAVLTGYANTTLNKLEADANPKRDPSQAKNYPSYKSATYAEAAQNAANGGLSIVGKPNGIGHLATFSVGSNIAKGEIANIGTATGTGFKGLNWVIRASDTKTYYIYTGNQTRK